MPKKKWLREFTLSVGKGRNPQIGYRPLPTLLDHNPRRVIEFNRGVPVFTKTVDTIQNFATGNRQYKPPVKRAPLVTDFDASNMHEMKAKFQFYISGSFPDSGKFMEQELYRAASDLQLLGFIKVRARYAMGHLQGDTYSASYMRRWMESRCNSTGKIESVHVFDDSYGIPEFRYTKLECIKDWRSPIRRKQHMTAIREQAYITNLAERTRERQAARDSFIDENHVRTY